MTEETKETAQGRAGNPYEKGSRYYSMYESNPYTEETFTRRETIWDKIANLLGFRSSYEAAHDDWLQSGREYDAQIEQLKGEDEYNSAAAMAERERAAGLNPDLVGLQGEPAGEFAQEMARPDINAKSDQIEKASQLMQGIVQVTMNAVGITGDIAKTIGIFEDIKGKRLNNAKELEGLVDKFILDYTPEMGSKTTEGEWDYDNPEHLQERVLGYAELFANNHKLTKKQKTQFENGILAAFAAKKGLIYDRDTKTLKARQEYGIARGSQYTTTKDDIKTILETVGTLTTEIDTAMFHGLKAETNKKTYEENYWSAKDAYAQAGGENAENNAKEEKAKMQAQVRKAIEDAAKVLGEAAKKGSIGAALLEATLPGLYLKFAE